jgi:hypothetical protein
MEQSKFLMGPLISLHFIRRNGAKRHIANVSEGLESPPCSKMTLGSHLEGDSPCSRSLST